MQLRSAISTTAAKGRQGRTDANQGKNASLLDSLLLPRGEEQGQDEHDERDSDRNENPHDAKMR